MFSSQIDPTNLSPETRELLESLLTSHSDKQIFAAENSSNHKPVKYRVPIPHAKKSAFFKTRTVTLTKTLVRYVRTHDHNESRFAVCEAQPFQQGAEGAVYSSETTIKFNNPSMGDFSIISKPKKENETRVVKQLKKHINAERENNFLRNISEFHAKNAIIDSTQQAALIMRRMPGRRLIDLLIEDEGEFDSSGHHIKGTGNIFTVDQRIELTILVGEVILNSVHHNNIIHRDINGKNILVNLDINNNPLSANVVDFGLAKWKNEPGTNENVGTSGYIAPEAQMKEGAWTDEKSDSFAFATILDDILWQVLFHDPKYDSLSTGEKELISNILKSGIAPHSEERSTIQEIIDVFKAIKAGRADVLNAGMKL